MISFNFGIKINWYSGGCLDLCCIFVYYKNFFDWNNGERFYINGLE